MTNYRITPIQHFSSQWLWFAARDYVLGGDMPTFYIAKANRRGTPYTGANLAVWSIAADTDTWYKFDNQTTGAVDIEFSNDDPFPVGLIYVSYLPMYPFSRVQRKMGEWAAADARIVDTTSTTDFILGNATARLTIDGRTAPALPFYGFKLTNASGFTKNKMILSTYNHPDEVQGPYQLEGAMSWLLGGSPLAEFLLDWFEIYIYPCINPQGVWGGYFRSSPQTPASDNNRIWDTTGTNEAIDAFKTAMNADTGGTIDVGIDFHGASFTDNPAYMDAENHTETLYASYLSKMQSLNPSYSYLDETITTILAYLWRHSYSAKIAMASECMCLSVTDFPAAWKTTGEQVMKVLARMQAEEVFTNGPGVLGSRDFNGTTDRIDWANVANPAGSALTISAWVKMDAVAHNSYVLCIHDSGDTQIGIVFNIPDHVALTFNRHGTTDYTWNGTISDIDTPSIWHHVLVTSDGGLLSGSVAMYVDGASKTVSFVNGSGAETAHTGSWSVGGRIYSDTRNLDGKIAQVGVWNRVLNSTEIANLALGYAPDLAAASGLQFYFKGNTSSLVASPGGTGTADGTTSVTGAGNGPGIIYS